MLVRVKLGDGQKFVKITELSLKEFLSAAFLKFGVLTAPENVVVVDESGTEVDDDVFEDVVKDPSVGVLTIKYGAVSLAQSNGSLSSSTDSTNSKDTLIIKDSSSSTQTRLNDDAKKLVESVLVQKPGGKNVINEYNRTKSLTDETRRKMVNILAADMTEKNGTSPARQVKEKYARGIVALFPHLSNPFSKNGYEHYYDSESGTGYLAWRIKTIQRGVAKKRRASYEDLESASPLKSYRSLSSSTDSKDTLIIKDSLSCAQMRLDDEAKKLVESILVQKPGGKRIINEYNQTKSLKDETRRKMVNILAADMMEKNGTAPPRQVKDKYARGIVALFPHLSDPYSKNGYEHYYDSESGTGYLAWRIKTIQRGLAKERRDLESDVSQASPAQSNQSLSSSTDSQDTLIITESSSSTQTRLNDEAKQLVESILVQKPGGERIINEYNRTKSLKDKTRRKMVNILAADMTENHGTSPPKQVKEKYARGVVALFPHLSDPYSKTGYEHYYDGESGTGYLAWRIKTIQRGLAKERRESFEGHGSSAEEVLQSGGPTVKQETEFTVLSEHECEEAIAFMNHSDDEDAIRKKMILTFDYRRNMVPDLMHSSDILTVFPRFKDVRGLIEQDFVLMFGDGVSGKLLEKWSATFKQKVIEQCRKLAVTRDVEELLLAAQASADDSEEGVHFVWDSDLSSILLLLHLIPPSAQGRKRPGKVSASQAERHLVVFKKSETNIEEALRDVPASAQPYLLAVGPQKDSVQYFIVFDQHVIPCKSASSLDAFDELFKAHFVFGTSYHTMLQGMYTFIQTTVYNIDVGKAKESPRVAEIRARLLS